MPLICTLVPAYKHEHLRALFGALASQSFKDFRIILCDDSPDGLITKQVRSGQYDEYLSSLNLLVLPGGGGLWKNHQRALDAWAGATPLVHILMDDDVIYPDFYREHAAQHAKKTLAASVSLRWLTRADGDPFTSLPLPEFILQSDQRTVEVSAEQLLQSTVPDCTNWLGELSNMVFSSAAVRHFPRPPADDVSYFGLPDIGLLLSAGAEGPVAVIRDHLSGFRQHAAQSTMNTQSTALKIAFLAWAAFALHARRLGHIDDTAAKRAVLITTQRALQHYASDPQMRDFFALVRDELSHMPTFERLFAEFWCRLLAVNPDTRPAPAESPPAAAPRVGAVSPPPSDLVVLDDCFPNLLTGFRVAEYNALLEAFPNARVLSTIATFDEHHAEYAKLYPQHAHRVMPFSTDLLAGCRLAYVNFINNADRFLPLLTRRGIPLAMTLYPGGGFGIGFDESNRSLRRLLASSLLRGVVCTQPITGEYLAEFAQRSGLPMPAVYPIAGVVVNPLYFAEGAPVHLPYCGEGKTGLDVCFVAEKYMPRGLNKGYPEFIAAAHALAGVPGVRFHVVGDFSAQDMPVDKLGERVRFHGRLETSRLRDFFSGMDLCVSLSRPAAMHAGSFDGFPSGAAAEASLCGVALVASDLLGQNPGYVAGQSIVLVDLTASAIEAAVRSLLAAPKRIGAIGRAGQTLSRQLYAPQAQIAPRVNALREMLDEVQARKAA